MRRTILRLAFLLPLLLILFCHQPAVSQDVDLRYRKFFVKFEDQRSLGEKLLNWAGSTNLDVGRSFALVAGVSSYPNMPRGQRTLTPAAEDIKKIIAYLKTNEFFDEIVVLQDSNMTIENLKFFLENYFPERLRQFPRSRFLFAYSGHGMTEGSNGFLLTQKAKNLNDKLNSINLQILKIFMDEVVQKAHHLLVLINSCYSGAFLFSRPVGMGSAGKSIPQGKGAHALTAGGSNETAWAYPEHGSGSLFFETVLRGIQGAADTPPIDNVITFHELLTFIITNVKIGSEEKQNPLFGDLYPGGSRGEFFFLNREKPVKGIDASASMGPGGVAMGGNTETLFWQGVAYYWKGDEEYSVSCLKQSAEGGNANAMFWLGEFYRNGIGVEKDYSTAQHWYSLAADRDQPRSMTRLGLLFEQGLGVPIDYKKAKEFYERAAEEEEPDGMTSLGRLFERGWGVAADTSAALEWYGKGASAGSLDGMVSIARAYRAGMGGIRDHDQGYSWYLKAAERGSRDAMRALGEMYEKGEGVEVNEAESNRWYNRAGYLRKRWLAMASYGITLPHGDLADEFRSGHAYEVWLGLTSLSSESEWGGLAFGFKHQDFESKTGGSSRTISEIHARFLLVFYDWGWFQPHCSLLAGYGWMSDGSPRHGLAAGVEVGGMFRVFSHLSFAASWRLNVLTEGYPQQVYFSSFQLGAWIDI